MLRQQITDAMKEAMKARDERTLSTVRLIMAALKSKDIDARPSGNTEGISDDQILSMLQGMIKQRRESIRVYEEAGRLELAQKEADEITVISEFLPRQLDDEETKTAIRNVITESGATSIKDMGRVMAVLRERYRGQMDFAKASALVKELL